VELDTILTSPYLRALDTAKILAGEFTMEDRILFSEHLIPPGNFEALVNEIHEKYEAANLALVGHEPMLSQFIGWLVSGNKEVNMNVKKGGVSCLSAENLYKDRRATLEWLLTPALLVALAK
jgi:phosphohistidine phosphatase